MSKIVRAYGYIRVSTAEQATQGLSLEAQESEIRQYAQSNGFHLVDIFVDAGITARKRLDRRVGFCKLMDTVDQGQVDLIIVMRLDRWFRNVYDYHRMMNEHLLPNKVDWCAVKEDYNTKTTNGRLMINLRLAIAEQECDTDSDRIKDIQSSLIQKGRWPFGSAPTGYKIVDKRLVKNPDTQPHLEYFFDYILTHGSIRSAVIATNQKFGTSYEYALLHRRLKDTLYIGKYRDNPVFCEPYLTQEQFDQIQYLISKNIRFGPKKHIYLFGGLLRCKCCGRRLVPQIMYSNKKTYYYYRCPFAQQSRGCSNIHITSELAAEKYLFSFLENELETCVASYEVSKKKAPIVLDNTPTIRAKQERVKELYINGLIDLNEYKSRVEELENQIVQPEPTQPPGTITFDSLRKLAQNDSLSLYCTFTREEKRSFWRNILKELSVQGKSFLDPPVFL